MAHKDIADGVYWIHLAGMLAKVVFVMLLCIWLLNSVNTGDEHGCVCVCVFCICKERGI